MSPFNPSELIEPVPQNITKDDWWEIWRLIATQIANNIVPGPFRTKLLNYNFVDINTFVKCIVSERFPIEQSQKAHTHISEDNPIHTKFGDITRVWFNLYYYHIDIECGGVNYILELDLTNIKNFFPSHVLQQRQSSCSCENKMRMYWETGLSFEGNGHTHIICPNCYRDHNSVDKATSKIKSIFNLIFR